jgi:hypothetical protein
MAVPLVMKKRCNSIAAALLAAMSAAAVHGGSLRKVWELDLRAEIEGHNASQGVQAGILAIRFSPDGKKIAVASNPYQFGPAGTSRLIIMEVANPKSSIRRFDIDDIADDSLGGTPAIAWSPSGDFVLADLSLVRLENGATCKLPDSLGRGFIGRDRIIANVLLGIENGHARSQIEFFDLACKPVGTWQPPYKWWYIWDVSPQRGFVSMSGGHRTRRGVEEDPTGELAVLDPLARKVIRSWPPAEVGTGARFADHGHALCTGDGGAVFYKDSKVPPRCVDVDTGETISEARGIVGGAPFSAAEDGDRVVASDHRSTWNFLFREYDNTLARRVVWDFRKNVNVASWKPETQTYTLLGPKAAKDPFRFAISPDGDYVAEGGNGIVRLYKIEP